MTHTSHLSGSGQRSGSEIQHRHPDAETSTPLDFLFQSPEVTSVPVPSFTEEEIRQSFIDHPMLCYTNLSSAQASFRASLKAIEFDLQQNGARASVLGHEDTRIAALHASLGLFLVCCDHYPHDDRALTALRTSTQELMKVLFSALTV